MDKKHFFSMAFAYRVLDQNEMYTPEFNNLIKTKKPSLTLEEVSNYLNNIFHYTKRKILDEYNGYTTEWLEQVKEVPEYYSSLKKAYKTNSDEELKNVAFPYEYLHIMKDY